MSAEKKPVVAITIGDPAGIGPEITVATMMDKSVYDECKPFLIGSVPIISRAMKIMGCDFAIHKLPIRRRLVSAGGRWMFWKLATTIATVSNGARCRNWRGKCRWTM